MEQVGKHGLGASELAGMVGAFVRVELLTRKHDDETWRAAGVHFDATVMPGSYADSADEPGKTNVMPHEELGEGDFATRHPRLLGHEPFWVERPGDTKVPCRFTFTPLGGAVQMEL